MLRQTTERVGASKVLEKISAELQYSDVKFHYPLMSTVGEASSAVTSISWLEDPSEPAPSTVEPNCPIYFYAARNQSVYVLPPAEITQADPQITPTLDKLLNNITDRDAGFLTKTIAYKNLVIPLAFRRDHSKHFVILYYNWRDKKATIYDSVPENSTELPNSTELQGIKDSLESYRITTSGPIEVVNLGIQVDNNKSDDWVGVLSVHFARFGKITVTNETYLNRILSKTHHAHSLSGPLPSWVTENNENAGIGGLSNDSTGKFEQTNINTSNSPNTSRSSLQTVLAYIKTAIKLILLIALVVSICIAAIYLASNPAVGIGLLVGAGAAVAAYGTYKFFKCCSNPKGDDIQPNYKNTSSL